VPGPTLTPLTEHWLTPRIEELTALTPMRRLGTPEDIAAAATFLASEEAGFVTGVASTSMVACWWGRAFPELATLEGLILRSRAQARRLEGRGPWRRGSRDRGRRPSPFETPASRASQGEVRGEWR